MSVNCPDETGLGLDVVVELVVAKSDVPLCLDDICGLVLELVMLFVALLASLIFIKL